MREKEITNAPRSTDSGQHEIPMWLRTALAVAAGAASGILLYEILRKKTHPSATTSTPLVDSISVTENGQSVKLITFGWDDDEMCSWIRTLDLDANGLVTGEKLIEIEYSDDRILISEKTGEDDTTPVLSTILLNEYGMATAVTRRSRSGKEMRWDEEIIGAELQKITDDAHTGTLEWTDGNVTAIINDDHVSQRMTYYSSIENHVFPDLNLLALGASPDMALTHILGTRTRNFISTLEVISGDEISHYSFSYLFDALDRPLQIHQELAVIDSRGEHVDGRGGVTDYDIKYLAK